MTAIAANAMASAPFGHAVMIQKSAAKQIVTNARAALTRGRQPIGHSQPDNAAWRIGTGRIVDQQSQCQERLGSCA